MPDAAREIIFPEGVPLSRPFAEPGTAEATPVRQVALDKTDAQAEAAVISAGEGDLKSEEAQLKRQAKAADLPGGEVNLLAPSEPASPDGKG